MNSQLFFFLNFVLAVGFLAWFLSARRDGPNKPTQLRMKPEGPSPKFQSPSAQTPSSPPPSQAQPPPASPPPQQASSRRTEKSLNVLFLYNGHDWDAYEVLGVPAGSNLSTVTRRYQELIKTAERGQLEFFEAAYQAVLKKTN